MNVSENCTLNDLLSAAICMFLSLSSSFVSLLNLTPVRSYISSSAPFSSSGNSSLKRSLRHRICPSSLIRHIGYGLVTTTEDVISAMPPTTRSTRLETDFLFLLSSMLSTYSTTPIIRSEGIAYNGLMHVIIATRTSMAIISTLLTENQSFILEYLSFIPQFSASVNRASVYHINASITISYGVRTVIYQPLRPACCNVRAVRIHDLKKAAVKRQP